MTSGREKFCMFWLENRQPQKVGQIFEITFLETFVLFASGLKILEFLHKIRCNNRVGWCHTQACEAHKTIAYIHVSAGWSNYRFIS